eukprot:gene29545-36612_t
MSFLGNSTQKSTIVITGGATGIGLGLAKALVALGHEVIVGGRRTDKLEAAKAAVPGLKTIQVDVSTDAGRIAFHKQITTQYPDLNVLINNAGAANWLLLPNATPEDWAKSQVEFATNLAAPIHLAILFLPHLQTKKHSLIANVSSMSAFFPAAQISMYSASKAGLHSFTQSLRFQLKNTSVQVVEIVPPSVATDMNPSTDAVPVDVYAADVIRQLLEGKNVEIGHESDHILRGSRDVLDAMAEKYSTF